MAKKPATCVRISFKPSSNIASENRSRRLAIKRLCGAPDTFLARYAVDLVYKAAPDGGDYESPFGRASALILGIMPALTEPETEKVLCLRDRMPDRQAAPPCVFSEAV